MTKIILTRHGHVDGIDPPRFRGRMDLPLTELGKKQAKAVAARVAQTWQPTRVYSSPLSRCVVTGTEIAEACGIKIETVPDLIDLDYGAWQWRTYDDVRVAEPEAFAAWMATPHLVRFPSGESLQDIVARSANALRLVLARHPRDHDCVVMVGHDTINRALLLQLADQPLSAYWRLKQGPCCLNEIEIAAGRIAIHAINEVHHLHGLT
jgi:probable phosphoglycerate mutase